MDKISCSSGYALKKVAGVIGAGQKPIVQFDNQDWKRINPVVVFGKQLRLGTFNINLYDKRKKLLATMLLDQLWYGEGFQFSASVNFSPKPPGANTGIDKISSPLARGNYAFYADAIESARVATEQLTVFFIRLDSDNSSIGIGQHEEHRGRADVGSQIEDERSHAPDHSGFCILVDLSV